MKWKRRTEKWWKIFKVVRICQCYYEYINNNELNILIVN